MCSILFAISFPRIPYTLFTFLPTINITLTVQKVFRKVVIANTESTHTHRVKLSAINHITYTRIHIFALCILLCICLSTIPCSRLLIPSPPITLVTLHCLSFIDNRGICYWQPSPGGKPSTLSSPLFPVTWLLIRKWTVPLIPALPNCPDRPHKGPFSVLSENPSMPQ